jgi:small subunit ribosomal protein S8
MYIDMLTRIRNAQAARHEKLKVPYSKMDMSIARLLADNKFIHAAEKKGRMPKRFIEIHLKYKSKKESPISGVKFVSTPARKVYLGYKHLRPVRSGYGLSIVSTPKGIMTSKEARKNTVGGQILFEIW